VSPFDSALRRVGIEPAERALCGWAGLCLLLIGATAFSLLNASETLFLKRVGVAYLPWALLASSGLLVVTTGLASYALAEANPPRWLPRVLLGLALLLLPLWWLLHVWEIPVVFGAFVLAARQVLALGLLVFWLALGDLVTGRQAKRLFAPLGAGVTLGAIIGSFASDPIARWLSVEVLASLMKTYFELGGSQVQFNMIDTETLRDAQRNPEAYRDLVIRVSGYSALFTELSELAQEEIISRMEYQA